MSKKELSKLSVCGHCNNTAHMFIVGSINDDEETHQDGHGSDHGTRYNVLKCPACKKVNIVYFNWDDQMESDDEISYTFLYPLESGIPIGLPENIRKAYIAAEKVMTVDVIAYVILLRRILELVCLDRNAKGDTLALMIKELAAKHEIPEKLFNVANGLRNFGNVGAHPKIGELSEKEIPIAKALCNAILEYIYSAPYLADLAENKLLAIKTTKK
jgi:uncharacterized protein YbaR (Trm112 family)